jgi:4-hydroxybenzoate polyprenyltransferase
MVVPAMLLNRCLLYIKNGNNNCFINNHKNNICVLSFLRLIRLPNLIILALGMYMLRLMVVEPLLILSHEAPTISEFNFFLIVISTVLIAAGGYIVNDIEDVESDSINNPDKLVIDKTISTDTAWNIYFVLSFIGICIGFYLTFSQMVKYIAYIDIVAAGMLYFYSTTYKKMILIGNLLISALTALSIAVVYLTEPMAPTIEPIKQLASGYVLFAFIISLAREIIKDMEDEKGDAATGCKTLPVVAGNKIAKIFVFSLVLLLLTSIILIQIASKQWDARISFIYVLLFIEIPLLLLLASISVAANKSDISRCSILAKGIMLTGILSMPVFYYSLN